MSTVMRQVYGVFAIVLVVLIASRSGAGYIEGMPYFHQFSNRINPSGSCQNTCVAMVLKFYGASDITPDLISAKWGTSVAQSTGGLREVFDEEAALRGLRVRDGATEDGTLVQLHAALDAGKPVIVHGGFSTVGHLIVLVGYDARYYYAMDPASKWSEVFNGGFTNTDDADIGRYTRYGRQAVEDAIISSDHRRYIRMHIPYFEPGGLQGLWQEGWADTLVAGEPARLRARLAVKADEAGPIEAWADLGALGGDIRQPMRAVGDGTYELEAAFRAGAQPGRRNLRVVLKQGDVEEHLSRRVVLIPPMNAPVANDALGEEWTQRLLLNAEVDWQGEEVLEGARALAVDAQSFTLELAPVEPVDLAGYRALRFAFHPGEATVGLRPAFAVQLNRDARKIENLIGAGAVSGAGIDLKSPAWQTVEIPLWTFHPLEDPLESITFFGNLRGRFFLDDIQLVSARFPAPHVRGEWVRVLPDTLVSGAAVAWEGDLRVHSTHPDGAVPQVVADLSALGGDRAQPLESLGSGLYRLRAVLPVALANGRREIVLHIEQQSTAGLLQSEMRHEIVVLPREDQIVFDEGFGDNWTPGFVSNAEVYDASEQAAVGALSQGIRASAFTVEFLPIQPVEAAGYRSLHFAFHPGSATVGTRPAFNVMLNGDAPSQVLLFDGEGAEVDMARAEWQRVEIPLERFYRLQGPITSLRILGNLRGTFYVDDVRLVADRQADAYTAVVEESADWTPAHHGLTQNAPNPFNGETAIRFALPVAGDALLSVYNLTGQRVATLASGWMEAGDHLMHWDGRSERGEMLATGLYIYRLQTRAGTTSKKMLILR